MLKMLGIVLCDWNKGVEFACFWNCSGSLKAKLQLIFHFFILCAASLCVVGSSFEQLKWSHYLLIIRSLETGSGSKMLCSSTHTITCSFAMGCCTEVPFSFNTKNLSCCCTNLHNSSGFCIGTQLHPRCR